MKNTNPPIFRRKFYDVLLGWKENDSYRYALMIEGVRRVGKSTIAEQFAKNEYRSYILIDFMNASDTVKEMFNRYSDDLDKLFLMLSGYYNVILYEHESLIIFDEIQEFPRAHQIVKYLVKYGKYPILETGSLITLKMKSRMTQPSEVITRSMNPMDLEEFMWAIGKDVQYGIIKDSFDSMEPLTDGMHKELMDTYRTYMIVGGMPQAVSALIETNSFSEVEKAKTMILDIYRRDVWREDDGILAELFNSIPSMLNRTSKVFSPSVVKKGARKMRYTKRISWLCGSKLVNPCYNCTNPDPAIAQYEDRNDLKMYFVDTGLLITMMLEANIADRDELYQSLLSGDLSMNQGMIFENMVSQALIASGRNLDYCRFASNESDRTQEVDFLVADGRRISVIEVKSSRVNPPRSLDRFIRKYKDRIDRKYIICTQNLSEKGGIIMVPIYMTGLI